jgi:hypothetical protein
VDVVHRLKGVGALMLINMIKLEYEEFGHMDSKGNLFLPLEYAEDFVRTCFQHNIALIGVDFIFRAEDDNYYHLHSLDCREIIWSFADWDYLVDYCNQIVWEVIMSEGQKAGIEYFIPYLLEEYEWIMQKILNDPESLEAGSSTLLSENA